MKILIVATSHAQLGDTGRKTGLWLEELAIPYFIFKDAGAILTLASPQGGPIPLDPRSESILASNSTIRRFQKDLEGISDLAHSIPLDTLVAEDFDLLYITGGHGAMWDFPDNTSLHRLLLDFNQQHKVVGLASHGAAALVSLLDEQGQLFLKGKHLTAYSNSEEQVSGLTAVVPFSLESKLTDAGASFTKGDDFRPFTITDNNFIYGQNAASAMDVSRKMLALHKESTPAVPAVAY